MPGTCTNLHFRLLAQRAGINVNKFLSVDRQAGFLRIRERPVLIETQVNGKIMRFSIFLALLHKSNLKTQVHL